MGAKAWFGCYFDDNPKDIFSTTPQLYGPASRKLVEELFPDYVVRELEEGTLASLNPKMHHVSLGVYETVKIIAHHEFAGDRPSELKPRWLDLRLGDRL